MKFDGMPTAAKSIPFELSPTWSRSSDSDRTAHHSAQKTLREELDCELKSGYRLEAWTFAILWLCFFGLLVIASVA